MAFVIRREEFDRLVKVLGERSGPVLGPVARGGSIRCEEIRSSVDLPIGVGCEQGPARFRLTERGNRALFDFTPGQDSWKRPLYPPAKDLFQAERSGGEARFRPGSRYRQWMTHKLAASKDQFGALGCVGRGRCITWRPAGIDITEQAAALWAAPGGISHA